jgi:hypothetical protein
LAENTVRSADMAELPPVSSVVALTDVVVNDGPPEVAVMLTPPVLDTVQVLEPGMQALAM